MKSKLLPLVVLALWCWNLSSPDAEAHLLTFDEFADETVVSDQYLSLGVLFSSPSPEGAPFAYGVFGSSHTPPNYLVGEYEGNIIKPNGEAGNDEIALPITITFVNPLKPTEVGLTQQVSFWEIYTNVGNVTSAKAYDAEGTLVDQEEVTGTLGESHLLSLEYSSGIHQVLVSFNASGSTGTFEDNAGIDGFYFSPVYLVPEPTTLLLLGLGGLMIRRKR